MSDEQMRKIIESVANAQIKEGYEDRVRTVANAVNSAYPEGVTNAEFELKVMAVVDGNGLDAHELKSKQAGLNQKTGDSRKDFLKDVRKLVKTKRNTSSSDEKKERINKVLEKLAYIIDEEIGNAFPDGDPFDSIFPRARKLGIRPDEVIDWLDRAVKKNIGFKGGYHKYLKMMWDEHDATLSSMDGYQSKGNPWG